MPEYHQPKMEFPRPSVRRHSSAVYFTCLASASSKQTALQGVLRLRGRLNVCCAFGCAFRWAGGLLQLSRFQLTTTSGGFIRSPHPAITDATTRRVAAGSRKLQYEEPPVNMQFFHIYKGDRRSGKCGWKCTELSTTSSAPFSDG